MSNTWLLKFSSSSLIPHYHQIKWRKKLTSWPTGLNLVSSVITLKCTARNSTLHVFTSHLKQLNWEKVRIDNLLLVFTWFLLFLCSIFCSFLAHYYVVFPSLFPLLLHCLVVYVKVYIQYRLFTCSFQCEKTAILGLK